MLKYSFSLNIDRSISQVHGVVWSLDQCKATRCGVVSCVAGCAQRTYIDKWKPIELQHQCPVAALRSRHFGEKATRQSPNLLLPLAISAAFLNWMMTTQNNVITRLVIIKSLLTVDFTDLQTSLTLFSTKKVLFEILWLKRIFYCAELAVKFTNFGCPRYDGFWYVSRI